MRNIFITLTLLVWTQVQALAETTSVQTYGHYNTQDRSYELSYDDLVQELAAKKSSLQDSAPTPMLGFRKVQMIFGYSLSTMDFNLASGGSSFAMSGIDIRLNGQLKNSPWQAEAGFKNYGRVTSGDRSAEATILTTTLKNQGLIQANLDYVAGVSTSFHSIVARDILRKRDELNLSLNVTAGLRGPLSNQLSWGVDLNAYSPISGRVLKGGVEATFLLSSIL